MNMIFLIFCCASILLLMFVNPDGALSAMMSGGRKAVTLSVSLLVIYSVWLGVFKILERAGITKKLAALLKPATRAIFGKTSDAASEYITLNVATNLLGMSGLATPLGIEACTLLEKENNRYAQAMLFVAAATSLQLLPTSAMSLMAEYGSNNAAAIVFPTFLSTALSTGLGLLLTKLIVRKK